MTEDERKNWWDTIRGMFGADVEGELEEYIQDLEEAIGRWEDFISKWPGNRGAFSGMIPRLQEELAEARQRLAEQRGKSGSRPLATKTGGAHSVYSGR